MPEGADHAAGSSSSHNKVSGTEESFVMVTAEGHDGSQLWAPSEAAATEGIDLVCVKVQCRHGAFDEVEAAARRAYEDGDYSFVENSTFQFVIVLMISLSCLLIGFEMDNPDAVIYPILQRALFVVFVFEIVTRAMHHGREFFCGSADLLWNWLDVIILLASGLNLWVTPLVIAVTPLEKDSPLMHEFVVAAELGRLLRILSLVRLVKNIRQLMSLLIGVAQAMACMMWVMVLMVVFLYAAGLVAVGLMRDGVVFGGKDNTPDIVLETFATVPESMFVFFKIINGDLGQIKAVFEVVPFLEIVYALFVVVSSWVLLSILTAVVSDAMVSNSGNASKDREEAEKELKDRETRETLIEIFNEIDSDKKGSVERAEFDQMLDQSDLSEKLSRAAGLQVFDLVQLFDLLENDSVINCESFVYGLMNEARNVNEHQIMKLESRLKRAETTVREVRATVQAIKSQRRAVRPKSTKIPLALPHSSPPVPALKQLRERTAEQQAEPPLDFGVGALRNCALSVALDAVAEVTGLAVEDAAPARGDPEAVTNWTLQDDGSTKPSRGNDATPREKIVGMWQSKDQKITIMGRGGELFLEPWPEAPVLRIVSRGSAGDEAWPVQWSAVQDGGQEAVYIIELESPTARVLFVRRAENPGFSEFTYAGPPTGRRNTPRPGGARAAADAAAGSPPAPAQDQRPAADAADAKVLDYYYEGRRPAAAATARVPAAAADGRGGKRAREGRRSRSAGARASGPPETDEMRRFFERAKKEMCQEYADTSKALDLSPRLLGWG